MYSLGGGCYAKWAMKDAGIQQPTYFFDYMWNLDEGLWNVIHILKTNFSGYLDKNQYEYVRTHRILTWDEFNINHRCPGLALMHYDTRNEDVFQSICRKVERTRSILQDPSFKVFLYYRGYYNGQETVSKLIEESEAFVQTYSEHYNTNFILVSLIELPPNIKEQCPTILRDLSNTSHICYDYVIQEDKEHWKGVVQKYRNLLFKKNHL